MNRYRAAGAAIVAAAAIPVGMQSVFAEGRVQASPPVPPAADSTGKPPPPRAQIPYWKRCITGRRCVRAVLPHFFSNWQYAMQIVACETGGTFYNRALGAAGERGVFQIHPVHFGWLDESRLWDVRYNARAAYRLSKHGTDWSPWACA